MGRLTVHPGCRNFPPEAAYGVYRNPDLPNTYMMAVGDAGIIISITPDVFAGFLDHHAVYSTFNKLPHPEDVMKAIRSVGPAARVSLDGKSIEISM